jgi:hypothetical protein
LKFKPKQHLATPQGVAKFMGDKKSLEIENKDNLKTFLLPVGFPL